LKRTSAIKVEYYHYEWKPSRVYHKIKNFAVSKDEWDTKKGTGKSTKNPLMHCMHSGMAKGTSWAEVMLNSKKPSP